MAARLLSVTSPARRPAQRHQCPKIAKLRPSEPLAAEESLLEGSPTDPADVPNQRTASERSAAERAASLRAVFASSPRPGPPPETTPRRPGEPAVGRRPGVAPATGGQGVGFTPCGGSA